jgi:hypothetical protein
MSAHDALADPDIQALVQSEVSAELSRKTGGSKWGSERIVEWAEMPVRPFFTVVDQHGVLSHGGAFFIDAASAKAHASRVVGQRVQEWTYNAASDTSDLHRVV